MSKRILVLYCIPLGNPEWGKAVDNFFESYQLHPSGLAHDFLVIYKSSSYEIHRHWSEEMLIQETKSTTRFSFPHQWILHYNLGFDIGSYLYCIQHEPRCQEYDYYVCVSTTSVLHADQWLEKLIQPFLQNSKVGLVGACGSWQHSVHIRTDFFAVPRSLFISCNFPPVQDKSGGYEFEKNLTRSIHERGYQCLIVNQRGETFRPWEWKQPGMFAHADYWRGILSSDHRTRGLYLNPLNQHWVWTDSSAEEFRNHPAYCSHSSSSSS